MKYRGASTMIVKHFKIYLIILILISNGSLACIQRLEPRDNLNIYSNIFIGEVVAIDNFSYTNMRKQKLVQGKDVRRFSDITLPHNVTILITHIIKGDVKLYNTKKIVVSGCGIMVPKIYDQGLFFIEKGGNNKVIPVYKRESNYTKYLIKSLL